MKKKLIKCPECGTINPKIEVRCDSHWSETCKTVIGKKKYLWGLITVNKYCNFIGAMDEDNDWKYVKQKKCKK